MAENTDVAIPNTLEHPPRSTGDMQRDYPTILDWFWSAYHVIQQSVDYINSIAGSGVVSGGSSKGGDLTLSSTSDDEKGKILLGSSAYDEANNRLGIGTAEPTETLDVNSDTIRVRTSKTPATASDTGTQGQIAWDSGYIYVCVLENTWVRSALITW